MSRMAGSSDKIFAISAFYRIGTFSAGTTVGHRISSNVGRNWLARALLPNHSRRASVCIQRNAVLRSVVCGNALDGVRRLPERLARRSLGRKDLGMAKQGKILPARRPRQDESLLLRSAESLGRMIGSLQRQLDDATRKLAPRHAHNHRAVAADKNAPRLAGADARKAGNGTPAPNEWKKSKRAAKSAASRKSSAPRRSGATRGARKTTRHT